MAAQGIDIYSQRWYKVRDNEIGGWSIANTNKPTSELNQIDEVNFIDCRFESTADYLIYLHHQNIDIE